MLMWWISLLLGLSGKGVPFPVQDTFTVRFEESVLYPAFGERDSFAGTFAFEAPHRIFILVTYPETQRIWVEGDTAHVQIEQEVWQEPTPLRPGFFLLERYDSLWTTASGYGIFFGPGKFPGIQQAFLYVRHTGEPESLRVETPEAILFFRFHTFTPTATIPPPPPPGNLTPP